jgi:hypothetical protein
MFGVSAALVFGVIQRLVPASLKISVGERLSERLPIRARHGLRSPLPIDTRPMKPGRSG